MSRTPYVEVRCDCCGHCQYMQSGFVRKDYKDSGWTRKGGKDYCSDTCVRGLVADVNGRARP